MTIAANRRWRLFIAIAATTVTVGIVFIAGFPKWRKASESVPAPGEIGRRAVQRLPLELRATIPAVGDRRGRAVLAYGKRGVLEFWEGQDIAPGVRLDRVFSDRIEIAYGDRMDTLRLPRAEAPLVPAAPHAHPYEENE